MSLDRNVADQADQIVEDIYRSLGKLYRGESVVFYLLEQQKNALQDQPALQEAVFNAFLKKIKSKDDMEDQYFSASSLKAVMEQLLEMSGGLSGQQKVKTLLGFLKEFSGGKVTDRGVRDECLKALNEENNYKKLNEYLPHLSVEQAVSFKALLDDFCSHRKKEYTGLNRLRESLSELIPVNSSDIKTVRVAGLSSPAKPRAVDFHEARFNHIKAVFDLKAAKQELAAAESASNKANQDLQIVKQAADDLMKQRVVRLQEKESLVDSRHRALLLDPDYKAAKEKYETLLNLWQELENFLLYPEKLNENTLNELTRRTKVIIGDEPYLDPAFSPALNLQIELYDRMEPLKIDMKRAAGKAVSRLEVVQAVREIDKEIERVEEEMAKIGLERAGHNVVQKEREAGDKENHLLDVYKKVAVAERVVKQTRAVLDQAGADFKDTPAHTFTKVKKAQLPPASVAGPLRGGDSMKSSPQVAVAAGNSDSRPISPDKHDASRAKSPLARHSLLASSMAERKKSKKRKKEPLHKIKSNRT